jgi:hypothetical protein
MVQQNLIMQQLLQSVGGGSSFRGAAGVDAARNTASSGASRSVDSIALPLPPNLKNLSLEQLFISWHTEGYYKCPIEAKESGLNKGQLMHNEILHRVLLSLS